MRLLQQVTISFFTAPQLQFSPRAGLNANEHTGNVAYEHRSHLWGGVLSEVLQSALSAPPCRILGNHTSVPVAGPNVPVRQRCPPNKDRCSANSLTITMLLSCVRHWGHNYKQYRQGHWPPGIWEKIPFNKELHMWYYDRILLPLLSFLGLI